MTLVVTASIPDDAAESNEAGGKDVTNTEAQNQGRSSRPKQTRRPDPAYDGPDWVAQRSGVRRWGVKEPLYS